MRKKLAIYLPDPDRFKKQLLFWSQAYQYASILDSNGARHKGNSKKEYNTYELVAGIDALQIVEPGKDCFGSLQAEVDKTKDWWFGYLSYDLKNEVEDLVSENFDGLELPIMSFFRPRWVFVLDGNTLEIHYPEGGFAEQEIYSMAEQIRNLPVPEGKPTSVYGVAARINREEYLQSAERLKEHIRKGEIYEVNFCMEFYAQQARIRPWETFRKLVRVSPTPYSCFCRMGERYLLSASPERFIKKQGSKLVCQPIKGTARRGINEKEDDLLREQLSSDPKERAENIMIVDLVRNDLSRTAAKGSVIVEELCGIYTFPQVHQMISTVVSELREDVHFIEAIKQCFPMGSMTGAPKVRAMKLIERYESTKRGLYSGSVGYISPEGDFDFNVVIRSIVYNAQNHYLSFMVGSAVTMQSDPAKEYEECLLKAEAIMKVLES